MRLLAVLLLFAHMPVAEARERASLQLAIEQIDQRDFNDAISTLKSLIRSDSRNPSLWVYMGIAEHQLAHYAKALEAFKKAQDLDFYPQVVNYHMACTYTLLRDPEAAFAALQTAADAGYSNEATLAENPDLALLRTDERFERIRSQVSRNARPCMLDDDYRTFDFWLGTWDVYDGSGTWLGQSSIIQGERGCALNETWRSALGTTATSLTYYNAASSMWRHVWVASTGKATELTGQVDKTGAVALQGTTTGASGNAEKIRGLWRKTDAGLTHTFEKEVDGVWQETYRATYKPAAPAATAGE